MQFQRIIVYVRRDNILSKAMGLILNYYHHVQNSEHGFANKMNKIISRKYLDRQV